jgi:hypothetical protein
VREATSCIDAGFEDGAVVSAVFHRLRSIRFHHICSGSLTKPILTSPAFAASAITWATFS